MSIENKYEEKLEKLDEVSRRSCYNYFTKQEAVTSMIEIVRPRIEVKRSPFGNYNSRIVYVVNYDMTNDPVLELLKKFYKANNADFYGVYLTPKDKTDNAAINEKLLKKELEIIKPNKIIFLGVDPINPQVDANCFNYLKDDLDKLLMYLNDDNMTQADKEEFERVKTSFKQMIKFAIYSR